MDGKKQHINSTPKEMQTNNLTVSHIDDVTNQDTQSFSSDLKCKTSLQLTSEPQHAHHRSNFQVSPNHGCIGKNGDLSLSVNKTFLDKHEPTSAEVLCEKKTLHCEIAHEELSVNKAKNNKHVNICTRQEDVDEEEEACDSTVETTALRRGSETSDSVADHSAISSSTDGFLTMTGTIKRGRKAGQSVDVKLNISREELEELEATITAKRLSVSKSSFACSSRNGLHIALWTTLCLPFAVIASGVYSFYIGTITWYNVFIYYTEEKPVICKVLVSPLLILFYPFIIFILTLGIGIYAGFIQMSWFLDSWFKEITDLEKGFYGWLCATLKHEDCAPYEVVILTEVQQESVHDENTTALSLG